VILGGAVSAPVSAGILAAPLHSAAPRSAPIARTFTPEERLTVGALAESILPRTDSPGALDAGVDSYIEEIVGRYFPVDDRIAYLEGLRRLQNRALAHFGSALPDCSPDQRNNLIEALDRLAFGPSDEGTTNPALSEIDLRFFRSHKELTVAGFYTSEVGRTLELRPLVYGDYRSDIELTADQKAWA
jgi:hypothetical protein